MAAVAACVAASVSVALACKTGVSSGVKRVFTQAVLRVEHAHNNAAKCLHAACVGTREKKHAHNMKEIIRF